MFQPMFSSRRLAAALALSALLAACGGDRGAQLSADQPAAIAQGLAGDTAVRANAKQASTARVSAAALAKSSALTALGSDYAPTVSGLQKVAERRISRTVWQYEFLPTLVGSAVDLYKLTAHLEKVGPGTTVVAGDTYFEQLARISPKVGVDRIIVQHDRSFAFDSSRWKWSFSASNPIPTDSPSYEAVDITDGGSVAAEEILVVGAETAKHEELMSYFSLLGWEVVGHSQATKTYQVRVRGAKDEASLLNAITEVSRSPLVSNAKLNMVLGLQSYGFSDPLGVVNTWAFESMSLIKAWENVYGNDGSISDDRIPEIKVGIVDDYFYPGETDLDVANSTWSAPFGAGHGNHMAGIIGARKDGLISLGVAHRRTELIGFPLRPSLGRFIPYSRVVGKLEDAARGGVRVVNISLGAQQEKEDKPNYCSFDKFFASDPKNLRRILELANDQTLFVQSAGNCGDTAPKGGGAFPVAEQNGLLAGAAANDSSDSADREYIRKRVLIVGASVGAGPVARKKAFYSSEPRLPSTADVSQTTSAGADLSSVYPFVIAPGGGASYPVWSNCLPVNKDGCDEYGTSQAAAFASGLAALVLQANSKLSSMQVRDIILRSADQVNDSPWRYMNAEKAVILAKQAAGELSYNLFDPFDGTAVNTSIWEIDSGIGGMSVGGGFANFGQASSLSTKGKKLFSGSKIVVEANAGLREISFWLVDADGPDFTNSIVASNTAYWGWGLTTLGTGNFNFIGENQSRGAPTGGINVATNGIYTPAFKYYRLTVSGAQVILERGDSASSISETLSRQMGASMLGRRFYLLISTGGGNIYSPGAFDWVGVKVTP